MQERKERKEGGGVAKEEKNRDDFLRVCIVIYCDGIVFCNQSLSLRLI